MALAGKIMPLPRGEYEATAIYDVLDIVTHDNKLWMAKRSGLQNVEPSEDNIDSWMFMISAAGASSEEIQEYVDEIQQSVSNIQDNVDTLETNVTNLNKTVESKTDNSTVYTFTVPASGWTGDVAPFSNAVTVTGITGEDLVEILLSSTSTDEVIAACKSANVEKVTQSANTITLYASGDKPAVDLSITVIVRNDANVTAVINNLPHIGGSAKSDNNISDIVLTDYKTVYVDCTNGSDDAGDGTKENPWATIQKAITMCPTFVHSIGLYTIKLADGIYDGFALESKRIRLYSDNPAANITITSPIDICYNAYLSIIVPITIASTGLYGLNVHDNSEVHVSYPITITGDDMNNISFYAVKASDKSYISLDDITVSKWGTIVQAETFSEVIISGMISGDASTIRDNFVAYDGAVIIYNDYNLDSTFAALNRQTVRGGRIQCMNTDWFEVGSATGKNAVYFGYGNKYTEYMVVQRYSGASVVHYFTHDMIASGAVSTIHSGGYNSKITNSYSGQIKVDETSITQQAFCSGSDVTTNTTMTVYGKDV